MLHVNLLGSSIGTSSFYSSHDADHARRMDATASAGRRRARAHSRNYHGSYDRDCALLVDPTLILEDAE
jgi:hypothetical protein